MLLGMIDERMLAARDVLMLAQFFAILNYFCAVYFVMWLRKTYKSPSKLNPLSETVTHVFLYVVYIVEIFNPPLTNHMHIAIYAVFAPIIFVYHVGISHRLVEAIDDREASGLPLLHQEERKKKTHNTMHAIILVIFLWILCLLVTAVTLNIIAMTLEIPLRELLTMYHVYYLPHYFNCILKVSFMSLAIEAYIHVALRNFWPGGKYAMHLEGRSCKRISTPRLVISTLLFLGMVFLAIYPNTLKSFMLTDGIPKNVCSISTIIFLQIIFLTDGAIYAAEHHVTRWMTS